jgi:hypothetical protein
MAAIKGPPAESGLGLKHPDSWTWFDTLSFSWMNKWVPHQRAETPRAPASVRTPRVVVVALAPAGARGIGR